MKTISKYREDIKALIDQSSEMDARAIAESRDLTEAEVSLKNDILDRVEELTSTVSTLERQERVQASLEKPQAALTKPRPQATPGVEVGIDRASKDKFNSFGQQLAAVMRAGVPGGTVDPRLFNAASGLNETVPSDGGFLVQTDFSSTLLMDIFKTGKLAPLCQRITISGNANATKINGVDETSRATGSRYGGVRGYWMAEADEKTKSKPKFRQIELNLKKLAALVYATDEMLDDSAQLESVIRQSVVSEFGFNLDDAIINGTGAGQPLGVLNSGALVTQAAESQAAGTLVPQNIVKMWARLFPDSQANAVWLINQALTPQLHLLKLEGAAGGIFPMYMPPGGLSSAPYGTLLGRPVMPIEQCQAPDTAGDIIVGDFSNGYVLAEKGGIKSDVSIHVRFIYDESVFRFVLRVDGQPVRATALTPYKGGSTATMSHFVTLAGGRSA
jgi:HK97 family phage major capsid protein